MKNVLRLEQLSIFCFSIFLFQQTEYAWWWYLILILTPDFSMLGYLLSEKTGAILYNFFHHIGLALLIIVLGIWLHQPVMELAGIILLGHGSLDRIFGYGLKYYSSFQDTHLGRIGQNKSS